MTHVVIVKKANNNQTAASWVTIAYNLFFFSFFVRRALYINATFVKVVTYWVVYIYAEE